MQKHPNPKTQFPGVTVAYDFVQPSYEWMIARLDAAHDRIGKLGALAATVTIGLLAVTINADIAYPSYWLWAALCFFGLTIVLGVIGAHYGSLKLLAITQLAQAHLHKREWELKKDLVIWAGENYALNWRRVEVTYRWLLAMTIAFGLEVFCLLIWLLQAV